VRRRNGRILPLATYFRDALNRAVTIPGQTAPMAVPISEDCLLVLARVATPDRVVVRSRHVTQIVTGLGAPVGVTSGQHNQQRKRICHHRRWIMRYPPSPL
jgi:hypothetical protein